jgi:hypothetical protein
MHAPVWAQSPSSSGAAAPEAVAQSAPVRGGVAEQVEALRLEVSELRAAVQTALAGAAEPPWAANLRAQLEQRIERVAVMQERLAARVETPTPRLTEPIVLFTVAGCTLLFGFVVGRGVQRRSARRDSRLRL